MILEVTHDDSPEDIIEKFHDALEPHNLTLEIVDATCGAELTIAIKKLEGPKKDVWA